MIFGVDYYPEQWKKSDWEEDFLIMKNMGLSSIRIAEFSWGLLEPKEGKYDFSFYHKILDLANKHKLSVILGTPTATFPPWLFKKYPEIAQVTKNGIVRIIGTRRQACFASKEYLEASERLVTAMAKAYGNHDAVIGWQIDNEPGHEGSDVSYSKQDEKGFRKWLKKKYNTIETLNETWGNIFWGILFSDWDEIPVPGNHLASNFNPTMIQDYYRYQSDLIVSFVAMQAEILKKHSPKRFLTTNLYPSPFLPVTDMVELFEHVDFVSWDNYPVWGAQETPFPHPFVAATLQYSRGLKNKNFMVMEQFTGQQGHDKLGYLPPKGQIGLWVAQAVFHGAKSIYFFRYRTALFGQEQLCYGILDHSKELTHKYFELQETITKLNSIAEDFVEEEFPSQVAVVHDRENARLLKHQTLSEGLEFKVMDYANVGYDIEVATWFSSSSILNVNPHFVGTRNLKLENYKMIILPMYCMVETDFVKKLEKWVKNGGVLVLGYRSGTKDNNNWMLPQTPPGPFAEMAGIQIKKFDSIGKGTVKMRFRFFRGTAHKFCEILEPTTATPIAWYRDSKKSYAGEVCATKNQFGDGMVYYIGTSLSPLSFALLFRRIFRESKIPFVFLGRYVEKIVRVGKKFQWEFYLNHSPNWNYVFPFTFLKPFGWKFRKKKLQQT